MADFHFLRPAWLALVLIGVLLLLHVVRRQSGHGGWLDVVDADLQPLVLVAPKAVADRRWPVAIALAALLVAAVALAGPTWERQPVPAFRSSEALVVALDLSRSMEAADLRPSRLARAKLKLLSLLERQRGGQTGLVVFSAHAFTVTPLTTDTRTISSLVAALSTDIMPSQGSNIEAGLDKAAALLDQTGVTNGRILVITDSEVSDGALDRAGELRRSGIDVSVLGVGTEEGAPIPEPDGGFFTDRSGRVVVPRLDADGLARLAAAGGGRFSSLTADERDLDAVVRARDPLALPDVDEELEAQQADVWRDSGFALALLLVPLVAAGFRRGWIAAALLCLLLPLPRADAQTAAPRADADGAPARAAAAPADDGFSWREPWQALWRRPDQRGAAALAGGDPGRAAELFADREWRAAAEYRAGRFDASAAALAGIDTADGHYNRGNALARGGELQAAIGAYDRALELDPDSEDARYNRALVEKLLEQQEEQQSSSPGQNEQQQGAERSSGQQGESGAGESGDPQGEGSDQAQASQQPEGGQSEPGSEQGDAGATESERPADGDPAREAGEGERQAAAATEGTPGPEDVEQWASEQAAEQWLRRIPQDPGGLLRRKFLYQYQRLGVDQDGNYVWPTDPAKPW